MRALWPDKQNRSHNMSIIFEVSGSLGEEIEPKLLD